MRDHLIHYVDLLFAGASNASDIKQEILQNTLDRFDDLVAQGKSPEAAYQLAISGIGDIREILGSQTAHTTAVYPEPVKKSQKEEKPARKKALQAIGICLYILCPVPLFVLQNELGLCGLLALVAIATALMIIAGGKAEKKAQQEESKETGTRKTIKSIISTAGLCVYFVLSFATQAWYITWIIFPLMASVQGLVNACLDLKEASEHEA